MGKPLMKVVLPRLARPLYRHLELLQNGKLDEEAFTAKIEAMLQRQHAWLSRRGIAAARAASAIQGVVLVRRNRVLRAGPPEAGLPLEVLKNRALREAAADIPTPSGMPQASAADARARLVAKPGE